MNMTDFERPDMFLYGNVDEIIVRACQRSRTIGFPQGSSLPKAFNEFIFRNTFTFYIFFNIVMYGQNAFFSIFIKLNFAGIQWGFVPFVVYLGFRKGAEPMPNGEVGVSFVF